MILIYWLRYWCVLLYFLVGFVWFRLRFLWWYIGCVSVSSGGACVFCGSILVLFGFALGLLDLIICFDIVVGLRYCCLCCFLVWFALFVLRCVCWIGCLHTLLAGLFCCDFVFYCLLFDWRLGLCLWLIVMFSLCCQLVLDVVISVCFNLIDIWVVWFMFLGDLPASLAV